MDIPSDLPSSFSNNLRSDTVPLDAANNRALVIAIRSDHGR